MTDFTFIEMSDICALTSITLISDTQGVSHASPLPASRRAPPRRTDGSPHAARHSPRNPLTVTLLTN